MLNNPIMKKGDKTKKYNLYLKAAKTSLNNANLLHDEASLLIDVDHFARGFALCVLSLEESSKAFLFRYISLNPHDEDKTLRLIRDHEKKLYQSEAILSFSFKMAQFLFELTEIMLKGTKDKQQLDNFTNRFDKDAFELFRDGIENTLKQLHRKKLDSLYVDIRDGKIIDPNQLLTNKQVKQVLDLAKVHSEIITNVVMAKDELLTNMWKILSLSPFEDYNRNFKDMEEFLKFMTEIQNKIENPS
ncbi:protein of unknown function [Nitrosotalea devaniterrae]|uniref:AbiV family abortive infection protein n=1 Tax=Nitrosotalea devaniterrae TaxID=1078905 RepID=A0A128A371_9ARCH|nr:protein of unknown function [Candidatus Nitrosotalea devanaterra]